MLILSHAVISHSSFFFPMEEEKGEKASDRRTVAKPPGKGGNNIMKRKDFLCSLALFIGVIIPLGAAGAAPVAAINCGGPEVTDSLGVTYQADTGFLGGLPYSTANPITGTSDETLYQTERFGDFSYAIEVPEQGWYRVTLKFAELYPWAFAGSRRFNVVMEGQKVVFDFDLFTWAGGRYKAFDAQIPVLVFDGILNIEFYGEQRTCTAGKEQLHRMGQAKVNAILVESIVTPFDYTAQQVAAAINSGGNGYTDYMGIAYQEDNYFSGGSTYQTTHGIFQTDDDPLYQTERFGDFSYFIPVSNGTYRVTLRFAEIYSYINVGDRKIAVDIEGKRAISNFDLYVTGGIYRPYDFFVPYPITVNDGVLNIDFYTEDCFGTRLLPSNKAKINAILVLKEGGGGPELE
jgi:hypothetical protein